MTRTGGRRNNYNQGGGLQGLGGLGGLGQQGLGNNQQQGLTGLGQGKLKTTFYNCSWMNQLTESLSLSLCCLGKGLGQGLGNLGQGLGNLLGGLAGGPGLGGAGGSPLANLFGLGRCQSAH